MKEVLIGFLLYIMYDMYQRRKTQTQYATKDELTALKALLGSSNLKAVDFDSGSIVARIEALENSPYA